eukprot:Nitzschia sp. Nitz4//scaffold8_size234185//116680//118044//NITZ4_001265-RA/size234185-processed-gene-0.116-mRNA-1//1//CDS//3329559830//8728//frame0
MASGALPLSTYHRAESLGSGSYGSVVTVYDDEGSQFALKLFVDEDDDVGLSLGALREISVLRLLRHDNSHPNIIEIHDVQTGFGDDIDDVGAGTDGCLSVAMPLFPSGSLMSLIESEGGQLSKSQKVSIAHGLLSAVAFLHGNSIMHRDIKSDNVLLKYDDETGQCIPVLIDFSLAKIVDPSVTIPGGQNMMPDMKEIELTHTATVGTATYRAPEVIQQDGYSFPSDLWSVGVCLLELLVGKPLNVSKDKDALVMIRDYLEKIPADQPFPNLIRGLLEADPCRRLTAREALQSKVFGKYGLVVDEKTYYRINVLEAMPLECFEEIDTASGKENETANTKKKKVDPAILNRFRKIQTVCKSMEWENPLTAQAALMYTVQMCELCDVDDPDDPQALLDCVVLAHKFFERELVDLSSLNESHRCFEGWDMDSYVDNEGTLFMMLDFCLIPRSFIPIK